MEELQVAEGENHVHLFSGGLDSTYALMKYLHDSPQYSITPLFIDYGQYAATAEWKSVVSIVRFLKDHLDNGNLLQTPIRMCLRSDLFSWCDSVAFTGMIDRNENPQIENRNIVLVGALSSYLKACARKQDQSKPEFIIHSGFKDGEMPDCTAEYLKSLEKLVSDVEGCRFRIEYCQKSAKPVDFHGTCERIKKILKGNQRNLEELLRMGSSCYSPHNGRPCRKCMKCQFRNDSKNESR